jgi:CBS-domain-containing membrane protein
MTAGELCTRMVATIDPGESAVVAAKRMREEHVGDLVVVEEGDRPIGIVTDRDLVMSVLADEIANPSKLEVGTILHGDVVTASEDEDIDEVLRRMRAFAVRRVPVLDGAGCLYGVLALDDILGWIREDIAEAVSISRRQQQEEIRRSAH